MEKEKNIFFDGKLLFEREYLNEKNGIGKDII